MKNIKKIDWDNYLSTMSYEKVRIDLDAIIPVTPTMFSPDNDLILLQSDDVSYETDDTEMLNKVLNTLYDKLKRAALEIDWSFERLYLLEVDYLTVHKILAAKNALPEDYEYPEYYFKNIVKMIGTGSSITARE